MGSAALTDQVLMVADERFGDLEAGHVADGGQAPDHTFSFEDGEVSGDAARTLPR